MSSGTITLLTDFGTSDGFVGSMKGVVLSISPRAVIVDISHDIPPQDIPHGAFVLGGAYRYFGLESVHVAVVDPGVGTSRRALLVVTPAGRFLAPDNGLLTYVLLDNLTSDSPQSSEPAPLSQPALEGAVDVDEQDSFLKPSWRRVPDGCQAYALASPRFWRRPVSDTFHGRDIFAPVAAHLSLGVPAELLGEPVDQVVWLDVRPAATGDTGILARIIFVDRFGNLVSNVRGSDLAGDKITVEINGARIEGLSRTYTDGDGLLALIGSHGYLELAKRNGSASDLLSARVGTRLSVVCR